jgi:hypothetical protein
MTEICVHFTDITHRLQLLVFLNVFTSEMACMPDVAMTFASHPFMRDLLMSLLIDESSTACCVSLTTLIKLLPVLAVHACAELKRILPDLLAILARIVCWKGRIPQSTSDIEDGEPIELEEEDETKQALPSLRENLQWNRLQPLSGVTSPPSPRRYFSFLYYLFPCNVMHFLRRPASYLTAHGFPSPYAVSWQDFLDEPYIRSTSEVVQNSERLNRI